MPRKVKKAEILTISEIKRKAVPLLRKNGVVKAGIFGSYARGEAKKRSDIDLLIRVERKKFSLLDLIGLEQELEHCLGKKVDLLTYKGINRLLKEQIFNEEVKII